MKKLSALFLSLLLLVGCAPAGGGGYEQITQEKALELMETETDYIILDVRTPEEFAQGHIPGAVNLPNETISSQTPPPELPRQDQMILVYCRSGNRSRQAAGKLARAGYTRVLEFGGINTWPGDIVTD